ncbi:HNH endonuclease [Streptomyces sp. NPDC029526]|uniref:HNH endonuclease n=1 Tax=Streptomyces sp. NPDC029526 TaxID=3155728 RepID=UPI0033E58B7E
MAVSKRLRFEIFRRDNHACRYCGAAAPGVKLTIDHVIPTSLGGSNKPSNLVTACADCNSGKTSSMPNAMVVADVDQQTFRTGAALRIAEQAGAQGAYEAWRANWHTLHADTPPPSLDHEFHVRVADALREGRTPAHLTQAARSAAMGRNAEVDYFAYHIACDEADEKAGDL